MENRPEAQPDSNPCGLPAVDHRSTPLTTRPNYPLNQDVQFEAIEKKVNLEKRGPSRRLPKMNLASFPRGSCNCSRRSGSISE
eukprot:3285223-Amphidinium_carterae.1